MKCLRSIEWNRIESSNKSKNWQYWEQKRKMIFFCMNKVFISHIDRQILSIDEPVPV